ncbi:DNA polymerase III [Candidatus Jorgensenbacteria bacterium CG_4_10_14_0_8_um_filter_39_13]|uniref:DNA polymerase beta n=2 Tax=Candidatus Joergenseniibacteriota TaxID=1752739 RepID=A0A2M7RH25_9BACT|nr:MAG: DNA polymerase III [Candidatus Jorgensenbacteria bacterium CG11_big_fil_rev_8_21_14_0_20_38_23]PIV13054.1 MAG: DNA polymerase III [Candidatus Jorgensenbacteria bacterium CG03_land_8_20_14_0_80_38_39]PIY95882.1 MAG: DNA polymerase III [Candidatus Jorgensenbacteria bacterium CG_4_10_14_0_8_um_filter_39_13]PJA95059.1 MAG: DNA polymerase III [Candidatus Jorgensenbacteria bacterium CG_4_9_14_3_um_filter_38_10]
MSNHQIAEILKEIGEYLEMQSVAFKPRAYEKAAEVIEELEEEVESIYKNGGLKAIEDIPGIGVSIAEKIEELIKTGHLKYYEKLKKQTPLDLISLRRIEGLGPKSLKKLYEALGIKNIQDLEKAAQTGKIRKIEGFGEKTEENILEGIKFLKKSSGRFILGFTRSLIRSLEERLKKLKEVERLVAAGSVRRWKETIGDADILVISNDSRPVMDYFVSLPEVARVYAKGLTKSAVQLNNGLDVDLRVVEKKSYGAALSYFTGSKDHNVALREIALKKGYKLNEYGLFKGKKQIAGETEEEIYEKLGLDYIEPEMRENKGEIELARRHQLPKLIDYGEILGDLQVQTNWTDGVNSIEEMAKAAMAQGLEYIAITDHTKRLAMANGLDEKRLLEQIKEIDRLNLKFNSSIDEQNSKPVVSRVEPFKILKGTECDILKDGSLDIKDEVLAKLDVVGVSIHSYFNLSKKEQTERIKKAISNPNVDILFHPSGRIIQKREAYEFDIEEIIKTAQKTKTVLEVNAYPNRLDLKDDHIHLAIKAGVKIAIDSDAHSVTHLPYLEYGISQARRGWAEKKDIINYWPLEKMLKMLK